MRFFAVLSVVAFAALALAEEDIITLQEYNEQIVDEDVGAVRIIGGSPAAVSQFPFQVAVNYRTSSGNFFCGGSLINNRWVLTAAHCVRGALSFTLRFGGLTLSNTETGRVTVTATNFIEHPRYNPSTLNNDIALIQLPSAITFNQRIQPIRLPNRGSVTGASQRVTVSGWGRTSDSSSGVSNILNFVNLTTTTNAQCASVYGTSVVIASTICAVGNPHHSTCNGDSGGPLIVYANNGVPTQVGVVSFVNRAGCASGRPSGYVRTEAFLDWISQTTRLL